MNIQGISNLPSDPDITVILVKESLDKGKIPKGGDSKSAFTSLVNLIAKSDENDKKNITNSHSTDVYIPISSWDEDSVDQITGQTEQTVPASHKTDGLLRINESPTSLTSLIVLNTLQNTYAGSEGSISSAGNNNSNFVEIDLRESLADSKADVVGDGNSKTKKSKTFFSLRGCIPCVSKKKLNEDA